MMVETAIRLCQRVSESLSAYRRRLKRRGIVRIEVHVSKDDAALVVAWRKLSPTPPVGLRRGHYSVSTLEQTRCGASKLSLRRRRLKGSI